MELKVNLDTKVFENLETLIKKMDTSARNRDRVCPNCKQNVTGCSNCGYRFQTGDQVQCILMGKSYREHRCLKSCVADAQPVLE